MSPVIRTNWLLTALILLLGILAWQEHQTASAPQTVTSLDPARVSRIRLWQNEKLLAELVKQNDQWHWQPGDRPLEDGKWVNTLLHLAELPSLHRFPVEESRLQAFGLKPPRYRLELDDQVLDFGMPDPASGLRYLRVGKTIHLITDSYTHELARIPDA